MPARLLRINTIPVYEGMSAEESYWAIIQADGKSVHPEFYEGMEVQWANIGTWKDSEGNYFTALIDEDGRPVFEARS